MWLEICTILHEKINTFFHKPGALEKAQNPATRFPGLKSELKVKLTRVHIQSKLLALGTSVVHYETFFLRPNVLTGDSTRRKCDQISRNG